MDDYYCKKLIAYKYNKEKFKLAIIPLINSKKVIIRIKREIKIMRKM
jgi:hypothetical protein